MTRVIYRIENPETMAGMWYNKNGIYKKTIDVLCPNGIAKNLPMPLNLDLHRKNRKVWFSAGKSVENMHNWFTASDAINLSKNGFLLFKFLVNEFQELENEILFTREGIINQEIISLDKVWNI